MKKQITKGCNGAGEASGSAMVALPRPPAEPSRYSNIEMQRRFSLRILLTIQVASAILMLILGYLYSPRQRILRAGAELHTNQTFGFDLNGNAWHGVMGERPGKTSAVNAAVFPRNAHFDSAIEESLNRISTIEYL